MRLVRYVVPILAFLSVMAIPLAAQGTGAIRGEVRDSVTKQALAGVIIRIQGTQRETQTAPDGSYSFADVPSGTVTLRATRIGFGPQTQSATVSNGGSAEAQFALAPQASILEPVVVTGYGTTRREAITGSVATVDPGTANVGVINNANQMIQGRVAGVEIVQNNGEPGAGAQVRIRGSTSIGASNEPLYVIDGIPVSNDPTQGEGLGVSGTSPSLARSPLALLNPSDIGSITILKDASATAIYGSRGANGVILIETKKGTVGSSTIEYDAYVATASPAKRLDVLTGSEYRSFIQSQVALHNTNPLKGLDSSYITALGTANTDWAGATTRSAVTQNQNLRFSGGSDVTRYLASLNYMNQQGVALSNGMKRYQGRLSATHQAFNSRLRIGLNVTASQSNDDYITFENTGGFEGGVFENVATFNPTRPVTVTDSTGTHFYEIGPGSQSVRNPVALEKQLSDFGTTNRTLGNMSADFDLTTSLTARINVGVDKSTGLRQIYFPRSSPAGAEFGGLARQGNYSSQSRTLQAQLTFRHDFGGVHSFDVVGAYEWTQIDRDSVIAEARNFLTDLFTFNNMGAGTVQVNPVSGGVTDRWISFLSRANYGYKEKYFLTGVVRYDGRSSFAEGHKWTLFPGISGSWHLSQESFMSNSPFSDLRVRVGYGVVGNPGAPAYSSLVTFGNEKYVFGTTPITAFTPNNIGNPNLTFERTSQVDVGVDYGLMQNRLSGSIEYYIKNTTDLLLRHKVSQPSAVQDRLENIGSVKNHGVELTLDALPISRSDFTWRAGINVSFERNTAQNIGGGAISFGTVSGQGQSGQNAERLASGYALGAFYGPVFVGVDSAGKQQFSCSSGTTCVGGITTDLKDATRSVIGNPNPSMTLGFHSEISKGRFDFSLLVRGAFGQDVFNNTALVYSTKGNALQGKNFLRDALTDPIGLREASIFSSRWIEDGSFLRLQNVTLGYTFDIPKGLGSARTARLYVSGDNLLLLTGYSGLDPEVYANAGLVSRNIDYLSYPRPRTVTAGVRVAF